MSGRFALFRWTPALAALPGFPATLRAHWNLAPGTQVLLLRDVQGERHAALARWGLTPPWLTDLSRTPSHARAETLAEQPMFREAFRLRRGLLPINGFYEWRGVRKRPYWVSAEASLMYCAVLWEAYPAGDQVYLSLAMVTQAAATMRRPLLLDEAEQAAWLDAQTPASSLKSLLAKPPAVLRERALATFVNDPQLDGPECLTPV